VPLPLDIRLISNPYVTSIPDAELLELIHAVGRARAEDIERGSSSGEYPRESMGFVVLDPTAPSWKPSEEAVLALIVIGAEGMDFLPNAAAKAIEHRDHAADCGVLVYAQNHRLADGDFRFGFSVCIEGTYVGGSGLSEIQDRYQATLLAADINYRIIAARHRWAERHTEGYWFGDPYEPAARYIRIWDQADSLEVQPGESRATSEGRK
jgi:hypothetical protein